MPRTRKTTRARGGHQRRISVRAVRRESPDLRRLGRAIVAIALAQAEADAEAQTRQTDTESADPGPYAGHGDPAGEDDHA